MLNCSSFLLFYSRVTNYVLFLGTVPVLSKWVNSASVPLVVSQGWVHACVWASSILLCPGFPSCSGSRYPVLLTPETSRGEYRFGNKWLSGYWINWWYRQLRPNPSIISSVVFAYIWPFFSFLEVTQLSVCHFKKLSQVQPGSNYVLLYFSHLHHLRAVPSPSHCTFVFVYSMLCFHYVMAASVFN